MTSTNTNTNNNTPSSLSWSRRAISATVLSAVLLQHAATLSSAFVVPLPSTTTTTTTKATTNLFMADSGRAPPPPKGEPPSSPKPRGDIDSSTLGDLTGGRPGAIIESVEQLDRKAQIFAELEAADHRGYPKQMLDDYGTLIEELESEYDSDDPSAIDAATLGTWTIKDLQSKFPYEWDPDDGDLDPNEVELNRPGIRYKAGTDVDDEGIDVGYDPMFGQSNPMDGRTILGAVESFMINEDTKDESMIPASFNPGDLEIEYNQEIVRFRKSLDIIETYTDDFMPKEMKIPRHVAKWHGYPEPMSYPHQNETNNRFLDDPSTATDWSKLDPYRARRKAIELARAQNADWLPPGKSQAWHKSQRDPYDQVGTLVGSLKAGFIDATLKSNLQPALDILGSCAILLSMEGDPTAPTVFRFEYHGLMKHRHGMSAWAETLIRDCGVEVTGVIFESGFRKRDMAYEGGDCWYPPSS